MNHAIRSVVISIGSGFAALANRRGGGRLMMKSYIICSACCSFAQVWTVCRETVSCACGQTRRDL